MSERKFQAGLREDQPAVSELEIGGPEYELGTAQPETTGVSDVTAIIPPKGPGSQPPPNQ